MTNVTCEQWESLNNFLLPSHREVASPRWGWSVCFSFLTPVCRAVLRVFGMSLCDAAGIINRVCTCALSPSSFQSLFTHSLNWTANKSDLLHQQTQCRFKTLSWPLGKKFRTVQQCRWCRNHQNEGYGSSPTFSNISTSWLSAWCVPVITRVFRGFALTSLSHWNVH